MLALILLTQLTACASTAQPNMNGFYPLSQTPHGDVSKFPSSYAAYGRDIQSFDVYSPLISQLYSQVFWKGLPPVDLPDNIVQQFRGKGMAVVGFEMDQVRRVTDQHGNVEDISVPLDVVYNHHFESTMVGGKAKFKQIKFTGPNDPRLIRLQNRMGGHGLPSYESHWMVDVEDDEEPAVEEAGRKKEVKKEADKKEDDVIKNLPTSESFGGANGGEYRLSYHGYAPGNAQVIQSPTQFQITPMQIDTWNRDFMNLTGPTKFVPGPVPRSSLAPTTGPDAIYSGLLECPLTTRVVKDIKTTYTTSNGHSSPCLAPISSIEECASAASKILGNGTVFPKVVDANQNDHVPVGCSLMSDVADVSLAHVSYRSKSSDIACGAGTIDILGTTQSLVNVSVHVSQTKNIVRIVLKGPSSVWFGVGFNASAMKDQPWAVVVEGGAKGSITERRLHDQNPGILLNVTIKVVATSIKGAMKTVVIERPIDNGYSVFDSNIVELPFINAIGSTAQLSYHKEHAPSSLTMLPVQGVDTAPTAGVCICEGKPVPFGQGQGTLTYHANSSQKVDVGSGTVSFNNKCAPYPRSEILEQKNPTCDARTYVGGQIACHHMWSLLDADQPIPWPDQPLEYHLKFRFWVQEYNASYHQILQRSTWGIASPVEYDVPKCTEGMKGCSKSSVDGTWIHTITGTYQGSGQLAAAHFHCHAPTCLSIAMYRCDKNVTVCNATNGELLCEERPIYGGTNKVPNKKFDEPGYILQPPCLWGDSRYGLEAPVDVDPNKYILGSVKTSNATYGHHGEMAWQQMYVLK